MEATCEKQFSEAETSQYERRKNEVYPFVDSRQFSYHRKFGPDRALSIVRCLVDNEE